MSQKVVQQKTKSDFTKKISTMKEPNISYIASVRTSDKIAIGQEIDRLMKQGEVSVAIIQQRS